MNRKPTGFSNALDLRCEKKGKKKKKRKTTMILAEVTGKMEL